LGREIFAECTWFIIQNFKHAVVILQRGNNAPISRQQETGHRYIQLANLNM
jgi:hypothetical protein